MKNKRFNMFWLFSCIGVLIASAYPLYMGIKVVGDMITSGTVLKENYPKYIIPYTPISIALLIGVLLMPLCIKLFRRFALFGGSAASVGTFFISELLLEKCVTVTSESVSPSSLEDWQMFMCYVPRDCFELNVETPVDILIGEYNPAFKLHFYIISVVIILSFLNCFYGFAHIVKTGEKRRFKPLVLQSASSLAFLGLCILACFTAFWRDGNIQVSALSAVLMTVFFVLLGVTAGIYAGSFLLGRRKFVSVIIPSIISSVFTALMYTGELILLHGHVYRFGTGLFFDVIPYLALAPVDIAIIIMSGCLTALICGLINKKTTV